MGGQADVDLGLALDPDSGLLSLADLDGGHVETATPATTEPEPVPQDPPPAEAAGVPESDRYVLVRDGVDHGPFPVERLVEMIAAGEVVGADVVRPPNRGTTCLVADVPVLREACERTLRRGNVPPAAPVASTSTPPARAGGSTPRIVGIVIGLFAASAAVLWWLRGGSP
ncbi:MAG: hypothetical protein D6705_07790 [Deltaproteobacteria bacterium]|nr:MAG: hypothetical protein D6705_07790 [Deltaproteobacteria bacterium]